MEPYYDDQEVGITIYCGDAATVLAEMPDQSVHCCVTSPPYWGLRDYGTGTWEGGDEACDHKNVKQVERNLNHSASEQRQGRTADEGKLRDGVSGVDSVCPKCGATRTDHQLGLEDSPQAYVEGMVAVFREVRRVLRDDGTLWLNLGDSYNGSGGGGGDGKQHSNQGSVDRPDNREGWKGLKPKDLCGIPWRVAFALQADGWYLRQDIIWAKPNPMPESVTDRCTKAHEYVFLLSKAERYYFDADAIKSKSDYAGTITGTGPKSLSRGQAKGAGIAPSGNANGCLISPEMANKRSVWTIPTKPYKAAHFAVFPPKLIKPCILAGCPKGGVVLDCFAGSGTTAEVSRRLSCKSVAIELNPEYCQLAARRLRQKVLNFGE
jgi:DNA modification methylase